MARISREAERYVGMRFLDGDSVSTIATYLCCSRSAVEAILRGSLTHLVASKGPNGPKRVTAEDLKEIVAGMPAELRAELFGEPRADADALVNRLAKTDVQGHAIDGD